MPVPGLLKVRTVVVPPAAAACGVLPKPMRTLRVRQPQVGVDVDDAGQHQQPGRVEDLGPVSLQPRTDALDAPVAHRHVGRHCAVGVTTVPLAITRSVTTVSPLR